MKEKIELGIGFVTGRPNVCNIINNYFKDMLKQVNNLEKDTKITVFILYDLNYTKANKKDFYKIIPEVYRNISIRYITPENIEEEKQKILSKTRLKAKEIDMFLGNGHARGRNTLMYFAYQANIDYLLFWDDDEYPVANIMEQGKLTWKKQDNINMHLKNIDNTDITIGYHCGYISPIPYVNINDERVAKEFKNFIEAVSNDIVSWKSIKSIMENNNGVTYANKEIAKGNGIYELKIQGIGKWVAGSTLCLNLQHIDKIPAFYNPKNARGEDTFFATRLENSKVLKIPVYHFHDGFLMYTDIINSKYPSILEKANINISGISIEERFFNATIGWIRYKPLLMYISDKENYRENLEIVNNKLKSCISTMNTIFKGYDFNVLINELKKYSNNVENDYKNYLKTNEIWNSLKKVK